VSNTSALVHSAHDEPHEPQLLNIHPTHTHLAVCFNKLLEVCVRTNDMDRGLDVLDRMADDDVVPDDYTLEVVKRKRVLRSHISKLFEL
jgi:pentatricopeptide repeat protein